MSFPSPPGASLHTRARAFGPTGPPLPAPGQKRVVIIHHRHNLIPGGRSCAMCDSVGKFGPFAFRDPVPLFLRTGLLFSGYYYSAGETAVAPAGLLFLFYFALCGAFYFAVHFVRLVSPKGVDKTLVTLHSLRLLLRLLRLLLTTPSHTHYLPIRMTHLRSLTSFATGTSV